MFFSLDYDVLLSNMNFRVADFSNESKMGKYSNICKLHLDQTTDVTIQVFSLVIEKNDLKDDAQYDLFKTLWFSYLKF